MTEHKIDPSKYRGYSLEEPDALISEMRDRIGSLERQLEHEREANSENRRIIAALTSRIPQLEAPPSSPDSAPQDAPQMAAEAPEGTDDTPTTGAVPQEGSELRSWWRRWFGFE